MLTDWSHWISSLHTDQLFWALLPILLFDAPRYALGSLAVWAFDFMKEATRSVWGIADQRHYTHCPSVCVIIAGLNEAETLPYTLASVWNSYPRMEIIVVDDGSADVVEDGACRGRDGRGRR